MYFETTMHTTRPVESAAQAAQLIHHGKLLDEGTDSEHLHDYDALTWTATNGRRLAVVADNHCNNSFLEVAVIDLDRSVQIESITAGWCKTADELAKYFVTCETTDFLMRTGVELPLDGAKADAKADFECGCCGTGFESTYAEQRKYDQDNGYGFCPECVRRFHS